MCRITSRAAVDDLHAKARIQYRWMSWLAAPVVKKYATDPTRPTDRMLRIGVLASACPDLASTAISVAGIRYLSHPQHSAPGAAVVHRVRGRTVPVYTTQALVVSRRPRIGSSHDGPQGARWGARWRHVSQCRARGAHPLAVIAAGTVTNRALGLPFFGACEWPGAAEWG